MYEEEEEEPGALPRQERMDVPTPHDYGSCTEASAGGGQGGGGHRQICVVGPVLVTLHRRSLQDLPRPARDGIGDLVLLDPDFTHPEVTISK